MTDPTKDPFIRMRRTIGILYVLAWLVLLGAILAGCWTPPIELAPTPPKATIENVQGGYLSCEMCEPSLRLDVQVGGDFQGMTLRPDAQAIPSRHQLPEDAVAASGPWFTEPKVVYTFHDVQAGGSVTLMLVEDGRTIDSYTYQPPSR
jgi:hypothetical protein